jgi:hypothetical protein
MEKNGEEVFFFFEIGICNSINDGPSKSLETKSWMKVEASPGQTAWGWCTT